MDELLMRGMPHSAEAEQAVLGSMLIDGNCVKDVMDQLQADDFYLRQNREIFETIAHMFVYSQPVDGVTVAGEMEKNGLYTEATRPYLLQLMEVTPTAANVGEYVKIVRDKALMRQVATAAANITAMVQEGGASAADMLESAEQRVYAIRRGRGAQTMVPVSQVLQDVMVRLEELSNSESNLAGLSTGFSAVDGKINGLNKSDLLLLAARPGMGKTSMALNVALSAAKSSGKTVAIFSLEMSREQLVTRLIATEGLVENTRLTTGNLRERLAADRRGGLQPEPHGHPYRRQPPADGGGHERQMPPPGQSGPGGHRLSAVDDQLRRQGLFRREPPAGGVRHQPYAEDHGQGAAGAGAVPQPAEPCQRKARQQAAHAVRPA